MIERIKKSLVLSLCLVLGAQVVVAQGNGPTQPEVTSFQPIGTSGLVNPSTGDFSYSIPLFEVGGYPISMSYSAGRTMDEQASNVGLGWNLNCGVITRNMRGLPDDFKGDIVTKRFNMRENNTFGVTYNFIDGTEIATFKLIDDKTKQVLRDGGLNLTMGVGIEYNTYQGLGTTFGMNLAAKVARATGPKHTASLGMTSSSVNGMSANASYGIDKKYGASAGLGFSARDGLSNISLGLQRTGNSKKHGLINTGGKYTFAQSSYTPYSELPISNFSFSGKFKAGITFFFMSPQSSIQAHMAIQRLTRNADYCRAFGTMYLQDGDRDALLDMNREKDGAVDDMRPTLDIPFNTPDVFSVSGHGFSGSFQMKRGDVGFLYDKFSNQFSGSASLAYETAAAQLVNTELDITLMPVISNSGKWEAFNALNEECQFTQPKQNGFGTEASYFRSSGETSVHDHEFADRLLGLDLARPAIDNMAINNEFTTGLDGASNQPVSGPLKREQREKRNELVTHLTAEEASNLGVDRKIVSLQMNEFLAPQKEIIDRFDPNSNGSGNSREKHHISEITALKDDGLRYVFGLPAYNWTQKDISFNVGGNTVNGGDRTVHYTGTDKSLGNSQGLDHHFMETTTPAYAHSFFLTNVLSAEFQDRQNDGPTPDDLGDYVKFNYTRAYERFRWRTPNGQNSASHSEGSLVHGEDDKGTIIYGEKEYWYVHSIESKTHVAEFHYVKRNDLKGVLGEDGGFDPRPKDQQPLWAVDQIVIYSLVDRWTNGASAVPVKKINFGYNYELYTGLPEHTNTLNGQATDNGKLTLKKVAFTYEKSNKGAHSAYTFDYNKTLIDGSPLKYHSDANDCWGGYKLPSTGTLTNEEFPYVNQVGYGSYTAKQIEDHNSGLGNISKIHLPSGGAISVVYESDDYAYVQDKTAMNFFKIEGFHQSNPSPPDNHGSNSIAHYGTNSDFSHNRLTFKLKHKYSGQLSSNVAGQKFYGDYLAAALEDGGGYLTLKNVVTLNLAGAQEWIKTFSKIEGYGVGKTGQGGGDYDIGWIDLKKVCMDGTTDNCVPGEISPIRLAAFQELRMNHPKLAYTMNGNFDVNNVGVATLMSLWNHLEGVITFFTGPNPMLHNKHFAKTVDLDRSFVRLNVPDGRKLGGGHRVKSISITDGFDAMAAGQSSSTYTTLYDYSMPDARQRNTNLLEKISSGVAEYEPTTGGEENPFKQPELYSGGGFLKVNNQKFIEHPYGESFMPGANVVYSRVTIKSELPANASKQGNGSQVQEFYTAKDFPVSYSKTRIKPLAIKGFIWALVVSASVDLATFSQGFLVELNDMHGKPKATTALDNNGKELSGTCNYYKTVDGSPKKLDNEATVMLPDGSTKEAHIGIDFQAHLGCRSSDNTTIGGSIGFDFNMTAYGIIPAIVGRPDFSAESDIRAYRSTSLLKVVRRNGLLDKVKAWEDGASVFTENQAYDAETGGVLLTKTTNEFKDPIYNFTMPAHWVYPEMGLAYQNIRGHFMEILPGFGFITNASGVTQVPDVSKLTIGDVLYSKVTYLSTGTSYIQEVYIKDINRNTNEITLMGQNGDFLADKMITDCFVMRSGFKNTPSAPVQTITSLYSPIDKNGKLKIDESTGVINAAATEYERKWQHNCRDCYNKHSGFKNFFADNYFGHWRPKLSWAFAGKRKSGIEENGLPVATNGLNKNIRRDGIFEDFAPFWSPNSVTPRRWNRCSVSNDYYVGPLLPPLTGSPLAENWVRANQVTKIHPQGNSVESRNALNLYSAQALGYMNTQVIAEAQNATYNEIGFEGYEDLKYEIDLGWAINQRSGYGIYYNPLCGRHLVPRFYGSEDLEDCINDRTYDGMLVKQAHTGEYALKVSDNTMPIYYRLEPELCTTGEEYTSGQFPSADACDCMSEVKLKDGKYVFSAWVKPVDKDCSGGLRSDFAQLELFRLGTGPSNGQVIPGAQFSAEGEAVEGWKRIYAVFEYNAATHGTIGLRTINKLPSGSLVDDIRIHPFDASFKSYVYDTKLLKLTYELDANNYFTKYEYDQQGMLERVKKETERGVMMVKESRYGGRKD